MACDAKYLRAPYLFPVSMSVMPVHLLVNTSDLYEVLVNRLGDLSLPRKSMVRLTDHPDMTIDMYRGRKTTTK